MSYYSLGQGLTIADVDGHEATLPERHALKVSEGQCLIVPYRDMYGELTDYYVGKLPQPSGVMKTLRLPGADSRAYFPKTFPELHKKLGREGTPPLMLVNDEMVAAGLCKNGVPAVAFQGLYGWRVSGLRLPGDTEVEESIDEGRDWIDIKLPPNIDVTELTWGLIADLQQLVDHCPASTKVVLTLVGKGSPETQKALTHLRWELHVNGMHYKRIRQYLPEKTLHSDLKDWPKFEKVIRDWHLLPQIRHPSVRKYLAKQLTRHRLKRPEGHRYAAYVMADIDACGRRLLSDGGEAFYFHYESRILMRVIWGKRRDQDSLHETDFGRHLYRTYGINSNDMQLITNIAADFTEDHDLQVITPHRVLTHKVRDTLEGTSFYYQLSDSQYAEISEHRVTIRDNGDEGVMFINNQVEEIAGDEFKQAYEVQRRNLMQCWWAEIIEGLNVVQISEEIPVWQTKRLHAMIPYISPWMLKWNGTQLPIEIITGEGGSGKSSLLELRQMILTGRPSLRNSPHDLRDWYAGASNSGGMYAIDNVQFVSKQLRQRLSDEICRIITEPDPHVEMRKLYTTSDSIRLPIRCTFAITALVPPFASQDILQRSFPLHLNAIRHRRNAAGQYIAAHDAKWTEGSLDSRGGRLQWVAHHVVVLQRVLREIERYWDSGYISHARLANLEQLLGILHKIFWPAEDGSWIPHALTRQIKAEGNEQQWTLDGLSDFYQEWQDSGTGVNIQGRKGFGTKEISEWAQQQGDYRDNLVLTNSRSLSKFLTSYEQTVKDEVGVIKLGRVANRTVFGAAE